ncbi:hypothetical protein [Hungatella hathewayi]
MKIFVKWENLAGGRWLDFPFSEEAAEGMTKELEERVNKMSRYEQSLFQALLSLKQPDSIEKVLRTMESMAEYELDPDIRTWEDLGKYVLKKENKVLPEEISAYVKLDVIGKVNDGKYGMLTQEGLVKKKISNNISQQMKRYTDHIAADEPVFEVKLKKANNPYEFIWFFLPATAEEMEHIRKESGWDCLDQIKDMEVSSKISELYDYLPPEGTIGELNQAAKEVQMLAENGKIMRGHLLAALEAEQPETMEAAIGVIRAYEAYEVLPMFAADPENYAWYRLSQQEVPILEDMIEYIKFGELGQKYIKEEGPVETGHGVVVNRIKPFQRAGKEVKTFCWYSPLTIACYNGKAGDFLPQVLTGPEAVALKDRIQAEIRKSLEGYGKACLAESLFNQLLAKKTVSMIPDVEEYGGNLWGVVRVATAGELTENEYRGLKKEWERIMSEGWGCYLLEKPIDMNGYDTFIGFWDLENGPELFIKTEEELKSSPAGIEMQF